MERHRDATQLQPTAHGGADQRVQALVKALCPAGRISPTYRAASVKRFISRKSFA
jgi:hypothetical protein